MKNTLQSSAMFEEGMMVSELIKATSINHINELRENDLINITHRGELKLTPKGRIARRIGLDKYLDLGKIEREIMYEEIQNIRVESRGLMIIFGGMFISLLLIIAFWVIELNTI